MKKILIISGKYKNYERNYLFFEILKKKYSIINYNYEGIFKFSYGGLLGEYLIKFPSEWDKFNPSQLNYALGIVRFLFINFLLFFIFFPKKTTRKIEQLIASISKLISNFKNNKSKIKLISNNKEKEEVLVKETVSAGNQIDFDDELDSEAIEEKTVIEDIILISNAPNNIITNDSLTKLLEEVLSNQRTIIERLDTIKII